MTRKRTGSQTIGPFFNVALLREDDSDLTRRTPGGPQAEGEVIEIRGRVTDGDGAPCPSVLVEAWQADAAGHHGTEGDPNFAGFGRAVTDNDGCYQLATVMPGPVPGKGNSWQAPHISLSLFGSGLLKRVTTRAYFPDQDMNTEDPVLSAISDGSVRSTLIAKSLNSGNPRKFEFNIVLQGPGETAFFDL